MTVRIISLSMVPLPGASGDEPQLFSQARRMWPVAWSGGGGTRTARHARNRQGRALSSGNVEAEISTLTTRPVVSTSTLASRWPPNSGRVAAWLSKHA